MNDMADSTAAIAWAVPVNIVELLNNITAFMNTSPAVHAFRVCHAFGEGPITKLPKEILGMIEHDVLQLYLDEDVFFETDWQREYCCFEGSCRAGHHYLDSAYMDLREKAQHAVCASHPEYDLDAMYESNEPFPDAFYELVEDEMDSICWESESHWEKVENNKSRWESRFNGSRNRSFTSILRKYFGLDMFVMHQTLDERASSYLQRTDKRFKKKAPAYATVCYLTLPSKVLKWEYTFDQELAQSGIGVSKSGHSMLISPESLSVTDKHKSRIPRAMRGLLLKPYVHVSQLQGRLSAYSPGRGYGDSKKDSTSQHHSAEDLSEKDSSEEDSSEEQDSLKEKDLETTKKIRRLEQGQWPKLMLLVSSDITYG